MNPDEPTTESPDRLKRALPGLRLFIKLVPLVAVLLFLTHFMTERTRLFPDNREISDPPQAEYLVFPPAKPVVAETVKPEGDSGTKPEVVTAGGNKPANHSAGTGTATTTPPAGGTSAPKPADKPKPDDGTGPGPDRPVLNGPVEGGYIVVFLSRKIVALVKDQKYLRAYRDAVIPGNGKGGKADRADNRAPLGNYLIVDQEPQDGVLTLVLNYPNGKDAVAGYKARKITAAEYNAIVQSEQQRKAPPFTTKLGGPVRIRGDGGAEKKKHPGDISITSAQMEELWKAIRLGTPVCIME